MIKRILTAVDGSEHSQKALAFACSLADKFEASLHILHIPQSTVDDVVMFLGGAAVALHSTPEEMEKAGQTLVDAAVEFARNAGLDDVSTELLDGDPATQIIANAEQIGADTIVLGSRGLGDLKGLLLGSVSHKVAHSAPCTCITVR